MEATTEIRQVKLADMALDMSYQRQERATINKIIRSFDPRLLRPLVVSWRDSRYYIVDGQHRYQALKAMGVQETRCEVFYGLTSKEEADIFSKQDNNTAPLRPMDTFKSNVHINDANNLDVIINNTIKEYDLYLAKHSKDVGFRCLYTLREGVRRYGKDFMDYNCELIVGLGWASMTLIYSRVFQTAVLHLYARRFSVAEVVSALKGMTPEELKYNAIIAAGTDSDKNVANYLEFLVLDARSKSSK